MEKYLYEDKVLSLKSGDESNSTSDNKSMIQLENTLLDMASAHKLCQGILYMFPVKVDGKYILRLI